MSGHSKRVLELLREFGLFKHIFPEIGCWYEDEESEKGHHWFTKTCEQLDRWSAAGLTIHPSLFFALFFGVYHEHKAESLISDEVTISEALSAVTLEHLRQLTQRITIPKFEANRIAQIMTLQPRFAKTSEKNIQKQCVTQILTTRFYTQIFLKNFRSQCGFGRFRTNAVSANK